MTSLIRSLRQKTAIVILFLGIGLAFWSNANSAEIVTGAGATFPYPIYSKWTHSYAKETGIKLNISLLDQGEEFDKLRHGQ